MAGWRIVHAALLSALILCGTFSTARAQFTRFQNYTDEQGLGNLTVTALAQDSDGYILVGTQSGLFRYDGTGFRRDVAGVPNDWIRQLATDPAGRIWVMTYQNGIFVGDGSRFHEVDTGQAPITITSSHVFASTGDQAVLDVGGTLVQVAGVARDDGRLAPLFDRPTLAAAPGLARARFVVPDAAGGLLIGCGDALCRAAGGHVTVFDMITAGLPPDHWRTALRTADGTIWVRSLSRLAWRRSRDTAFTAVAVPGQHTSYFAGSPDDLQLTPDRAGGVFTQGDDGLLDWTGSIWRVSAPHTGGLPTAAITTLMWDREGSLWTGSEGFGAFRSAGLGVWEHWTKEDGLPSSAVWGHTRAADGRLWVATDAGSVALGGGGDVGGENFVAAASRAGRLWLAPTAGPLTRIDRAGQAAAHLPSIGNVYGAMVDRENRLWLTTETGLFEVPDADANAPDLRLRKALPAHWCHVAESPAAVDWAVCRDGLFRRDPGGTFQRAILPASLRHEGFEEAGFTASGEIWLGTVASGVLPFHVAGNRLEPVTRPGLTAIGTDSVMFITRDRHGWMWVGTSHGIDRFDGHSWRRFDSSDGPISNDMDEYSVFEDADGSMWFGTTHGLSHLIDPAHLPPQQKLHPLVTSVSLGNRPLPPAPSIHVAWSPEPLVVRFNDLDYARGRGLVFRYRLQGVDAGWNETAAHEVRYARLPAGRLRFELAAVDTVHGTVSDARGFTIRMDPPWWRGGWFMTLCALVASGIIVAAWRFRVRLLLLRQRRLEDEQDRLEQVVRARTAEIEHAKDQLQRQAADLHRLAMSDALTGLPNRHAIMGALEAAIAEARLAGPPLAVVICDVDHFKAINDTFGHLAGDEVLAVFGARFGAAIVPPEAAGRYGGEEFLLILRGAAIGVRTRLAAIQAAIVGAPFRMEAIDRTVTISCGLAFLRDDDTLFSLLARADAALYRAKANGRNRVEEECRKIASSTADRPEDPTATLKRDLRMALECGEFMLHYQPILDVEHDRITSYEALLRWQSPSRGPVSPAAFIPFAEQHDLMTGIDDWVIRTACREAARWPDDLRVSVNLSPSRFRQADLVRNIAAALAETGLAAGRLELELTETAMIVDVEAAAQVLQQLRGLGITIALDDFGTGYSSLSFLRTLPFDRIKIDRSFVRDLGSRPEATAIIGSVIHLCRGLGTAVTAEGVETRAQIEMLRAIGCRELQGYEIGRPMPAERIGTERRARENQLRVGVPERVL